MRIALLTSFLLVLGGCSQHAEGTDSIGVATMREDGTLVLQLRAETDDGVIGDALLEYPPSHPKYREVLEHVGPLDPGEEVVVRPFPKEGS